MNRREFIRGAAALGLVSGCASPSAEKPVASGEIRAYLMHLGWNMAGDCPLPGTSFGPYKTPEQMSSLVAADHFRTDMGVWNRVTEQMAKDGYNAILIDICEALRFPSHPEIAVRGSWSPERMREELRRLRALGLEPIPKMNFSTSHDIWLGIYSRMVSTRKYYSVCADLIRDVAEIFNRPRFLHLGMDEEVAYHQRGLNYAVVRQGDLWWHDLRWFADTTAKAGMRPWIWSDRLWHHKQDFLSKMPKDILQSNWYYGKSFAPDRKLKKLEKDYECKCVEAYLELEKAGFDQVPCGSTWSCDENFANTIEFCRKNIAPSRLKGFLMAPWFEPQPCWEQKLLDACRVGHEAFAHEEERTK